MKPIFVLSLLSVFVLTRSQYSAVYPRRLNIYKDPNAQVIDSQNRTPETELRTTPSTTTILTTSDPTTAKPTTIIKPKPFSLYVKPAWSLAQIQKQYFKTHGTRHNATIYITSRDDETSMHEARHTKPAYFASDEAIYEIKSTTTYTYPTPRESSETIYETTHESTEKVTHDTSHETTHKTIHETTHESTHETTDETTCETTHEIPTSSTQNDINEATFKTLTQNLQHRSIYYGKVNKKPTMKRQTHRHRKLYVRPVYNTSKLLAFL